MFESSDVDASPFAVIAPVRGRSDVGARRGAGDGGDPTGCPIVTGCDVDWRLERDHRVPYAQCHTTSLDGLGRMCWWHHLLKTKGWALVGGPGCYRLTPPGTDAGSRTPPRT